MMPKWTWIAPVLAIALLGLAQFVATTPILALIDAIALMGAVFAAVHHAEVVAHKLGEPFGTLVLAVAVTVIEASLILSLMMGSDQASPTLARDTLYAAVMIICTGVVGLCVLLGGLRHREQSFRVEGAGAGFAALIAMSGMTLVLPSFTLSTAAATYNVPQLAFVAVMSLLLWAVFVFVQTIRHRDYFLPPSQRAGLDEHAAPPSSAQAWASFGLLLVSLIAVVGLAKTISPSIERAVVAVGAPKAVIGIIIAILVLLPETWAAVRAARADRLQTSINLAIGSALASIGLTVPVVAVASIAFDLPLVLGLADKELVLLVMTFMVSMVTLATGRTHVMLGAIHMVLFMAFLFLALVP